MHGISNLVIPYNVQRTILNHHGIRAILQGRIQGIAEVLGLHIVGNRDGDAAPIIAIHTDLILTNRRTIRRLHRVGKTFVDIAITLDKHIVLAAGPQFQIERSTVPIGRVHH